MCLFVYSPFLVYAEISDASLSKSSWVTSMHAMPTTSKMDSLTDEIESILYIAREVMGES
jgi:hypothetical protein